MIAKGVYMAHITGVLSYVNNAPEKKVKQVIFLDMQRIVKQQ